MSEPATPPADSARARRDRLFWVGLIVALLAGQIILMAVVLYLATSDSSVAVEPNYYQQALNWDAVAAQTRQNERLGWSVRLELGQDVSVRGERALMCILTDRERQPLDGATVQVVAFPHARGNDRTAATLSDAGNGRYEAAVRFTRRGLWEFRLVIQRGGDTFTWFERREVGS